MFSREISCGNDSIRLTLLNDSVVAYPLSEVERCETSRPQDLPVFTSFKFNNKYNDQVYTDVQAELVSDTLVQATVGAIGKRLTPSFQLNDAGAKAYVEGRLQESKVSRLRFDPEVVYTLAYDGWRECSYRKLQDEEWQIPGGERTRVTLTADMLSTNAPSNYEETEGLDKVLDGNLNTFFHSTWGSGSYEKLPLNKYPYVEINLPEALENISFYYPSRCQPRTHGLEHPSQCRRQHVERGRFIHRGLAHSHERALYLARHSIGWSLLPFATGSDGGELQELSLFSRVGTLQCNPG